MTVCLPFLPAQGNGQVDRLFDAIETKVIEWRHHIHQHPELSNREFETAKYVAAHLRGLGIEVRTGIAHTGVVGILKGGKPGSVVGLRADMDALPVRERVDIPYASKATSTYLGQEVGVEGIFSDWPATVTYYANCFGLE